MSLRLGGIGSLMRQEDGAASIEYVLLLAILLSGLALSAQTLGTSASSSLTPLAANSAGIAPGIDSSVEPLSASASLAGSTTSRTAPQAVVLITRHRPVIAGFNVGLLLCLLCYRLHQRHVQNGDKPEEDEWEAQDRHGAVFAKRQKILAFLAHHLDTLLEGRLLVRHLMTAKVVTVRTTETIERAKAIMHERRMRHLLVVSKTGTVCGVVSDRDLAGRHEGRVGRIMTRQPILVAPNDPLNPAVTVMIHRRISCLPVVEDGVPCGVLTATDVMLGFQCLLQTIQRAELKADSDFSRPLSISEFADGGDFDGPCERRVDALETGEPVGKC